jgi:hypothetical protein
MCRANGISGPELLALIAGDLKECGVCTDEIEKFELVQKLLVTA